MQSAVVLAVTFPSGKALEKTGLDHSFQVMLVWFM
jgi:hypothetical protein